MTHYYFDPRNRSIIDSSKPLLDCENLYELTELEWRISQIVKLYELEDILQASKKMELLLWCSGDKE